MDPRDDVTGGPGLWILGGVLLTLALIEIVLELVLIFYK